MLVIGELKRASELGFKGNAIHIYEQCPQCGKARWHRRDKVRRLCPECGSVKGGLSHMDNNREWKRASELGRSIKDNPILYRGNCPDCGVELWQRHKDIGKRRCNECYKKYSLNGNNHPMWQGSRHLRKDGYIAITLSRDDPFFSMVTKSGRMLEHRYVMAKHLGRILEPWEIVHHKNGAQSDNRIENLELIPKQSVHLCITSAETQIRLLKVQVKALSARVVYLENLLRQGNPELNSGSNLDKCVETMGFASSPLVK